MSDETYQPDTQQHTLRDRIAAALAAHEPVTQYDGADGECIECDLMTRWPDLDAPTGPTAGWKQHAAHMADAVIAELGLKVQAGFSTMETGARADDYRYITDWWPIPCDGKCARYECACPIPDRDDD